MTKAENIAELYAGGYELQALRACAQYAISEELAPSGVVIEWYFSDGSAVRRAGLGEPLEVMR